MSRYRISLTWHDDHVEVVFDAMVPTDAQHAAHLVEVGIFRANEEPLVRRQVGELRLTEMLPKQVKQAARAWLFEHDPAVHEIEWQIAVKTDLDTLERFAARVGGDHP